MAYCIIMTDLKNGLVKKEAEKLKMVMHVYTKEDLKIETEKIAQKIAQGAPMAIMYMKKMLNKSFTR